MSLENPKICRFHIVWMTGKNTEEGTPLSSGVTVPAHSMLEALVTFNKDVSSVEPIYVLNLDADTPVVGINK
jgi:hypothetical protein